MDCLVSPVASGAPSTRDQGPSLQSSEMMAYSEHEFFCRVVRQFRVPRKETKRLTSRTVRSRMIESLTRHPSPILTFAPIETFGPIFALA